MGEWCPAYISGTIANVEKGPLKKGFERCSDGGIFQICALFSPGTLGKISPHFDLRIFFQRGWFNHQA